MPLEILRRNISNFRYHRRGRGRVDRQHLKNKIINKSNLKFFNLGTQVIENKMFSFHSICREMRTILDQGPSTLLDAHKFVFALFELSVDI